MANRLLRSPGQEVQRGADRHQTDRGGEAAGPRTDKSGRPAKSSAPGAREGWRMTAVGPLEEITDAEDASQPCLAPAPSGSTRAWRQTAFGCSSCQAGDRPSLRRRLDHPGRLPRLVAPNDCRLRTTAGCDRPRRHQPSGPSSSTFSVRARSDTWPDLDVLMQRHGLGMAAASDDCASPD